MEDRILILSSWCHGLGASRLIEGMKKDKTLEKIEFASDPWNTNGIRSIEIKFLNKRISRIISLFRKYDFSGYKSVLVMADIPNRVRGAKQYVYFHNPGILSNKSIKAKIARFLISKRRNCEIIVQTEYIRDEISKIFKGKVHVMLPPILSKSILKESPLSKKNNYIYYPARNYNHKNIHWLVKSYKDSNIDLYVNLTADEGSDLEVGKNINCIGEVEETINTKLIVQAAAIIISSSLESLCLPILEARRFGVPLIVPKEKYVFELLTIEDAYFYDLFDAKSLNNVIDTFIDDYKKGLQRIPRNYEIRNWEQLFKLLMKEY